MRHGASKRVVVVVIVFVFVVSMQFRFDAELVICIRSERRVCCWLASAISNRHAFAGVVAQRQRW